MSQNICILPLNLSLTAMRLREGGLDSLAITLYLYNRNNSLARWMYFENKMILWNMKVLFNEKHDFNLPTQYIFLKNLFWNNCRPTEKLHSIKKTLGILHSNLPTFNMLPLLVCSLYHRYFFFRKKYSEQLKSRFYHAPLSFNSLKFIS